MGRAGGPGTRGRRPLAAGGGRHPRQWAGRRGRRWPV